MKLAQTPSLSIGYEVRGEYAVPIYDRSGVVARTRRVPAPRSY
jgi:hypothetical protein